MEKRLAALLRIDAVLALAAAFLLLSSTWTGLWDFLDLPQPEPWLWGTFAGGLLLAICLLLAVGAENAESSRLIARVTAAMDVWLAAIVVVWQLGDDGRAVPDRGRILLWVLAAVLVVLVPLKWAWSRPRRPAG